MYIQVENLGFSINTQVKIISPRTTANGRFKMSISQSPKYEIGQAVLGLLTEIMAVILILSSEKNRREFRKIKTKHTHRGTPVSFNS